MNQPSRTRAAIVAAGAVLAAVSGVAVVRGWSATGFVAAAAAASAAFLMIIFIVPLVEILEKWREEQREVFWVVVVAATILSGIVIDVATRWLMGSSPR
jgi:hypothetical protein